MKDIINYYYNLNVESVEDWDTIYFFKWNRDNFYFVPLKRTEKELVDLIEVSKELKLRGIECHDILLNKFGKFNNKNTPTIKIYKTNISSYLS